VAWGASAPERASDVSQVLLQSEQGREQDIGEHRGSEETTFPACNPHRHNPLMTDLWPDKTAILQMLVDQIAQEIAEMTRIARESAQAAVHEENRAEGDKDMRSTEASYLARGQAARVKELEHAVAVLSALKPQQFESTTPIQSGALVRLVRGRRDSLCFLAPSGGGRQVKLDGIDVSIVTPQSPLGSALLGLTVGDEAEISDQIAYEIVAIR
jgi:hypothetical protein